MQAYALQTYLTQHGQDTTIINYIPNTCDKSFFRCFRTRRMAKLRQNLSEYLKERKLATFRDQNLRLTQRYGSLLNLKEKPPDCDVYICGSDQIWNPSFTRDGEHKLTLSYFLDFGEDTVKRISYAASFGCVDYPLDLIEVIKPLLQRFNALSVRESTGVDILAQMECKHVRLLPDPTLLLQCKDYKMLLNKTACTSSNTIFVYSLRHNQETIRSITSQLMGMKDAMIKICDETTWGNTGVKEWLASIAAAKAIVTNSFHGVVFSILFEKTFIALPIEGPGEGMNDRIFTLLGQLNLKHRICVTPNRERLCELLNHPIDWSKVGKMLTVLRQQADAFFDETLDNDMSIRITELKDDVRSPERSINVEA